MSTQPEPRLAPPGGGLPVWEWLAARVLFSFRRKWRQRSDFEASFARERSKIAALIRDCSAERGSRRVLVERLPGLEDSSRFWSVWMTLDHLRIVNDAVADLIADLVRGVVPPGKASTAAVKPSVAAGPDVVAEWQAACDTLIAVVAASPDLRTSARYAHPWFGPLDASGWHALAGTHMGIHRKQIARILADP